MIRLYVLAILVIGAAVYANSFDGVLLFDDGRYIVENHRIRDLADLPTLVSGRRPVLDATLAINYAIGGTTSLGSYHAFNLVVHLLAGLTLFSLVRRTLLCDSLRDRFGSVSTHLAGWTAILWVIHPLQTQSVTYVVQRSESMMGLFYLLTLYCVVRGTTSARGRWWCAAATAACALGMGSKGVMVTAPLVVLLYDRFFIAGSFAEVLRRRRLWYVALFATWLMLIVTDVAPGVLSTGRGNASAGFSFARISPIAYALTQPGVLMRYGCLSVWPAPLCLDYYWPVAASPLHIVMPLVTIVALLVGAIALGVRRKAIAFAGVWFFFILAPTSSIVPLQAPLFEHRMYLPLAAIITLAVVGGYLLLKHLSLRLAFASRSADSLAFAIVMLAAIPLALGTVSRNRDYHSKLSMWTSNVATRPNNSRARDSLGAAQYRNIETRGDAEASYRRAIELDPLNANAHYNLAVVFTDQGDVAKSMDEYRAAIRLKKAHVGANSNLGATLATLGRHEEAIEYLRVASQRDRMSAGDHQNLAISLYVTGRFAEAVEASGRAMAIDPELAKRFGRVGVGLALAAQGRSVEALDVLRQATAAESHDPLLHFALGAALEASGRTDEATASYRATLAIRPDHEGALRRLDAISQP